MNPSTSDSTASLPATVLDFERGGLKLGQDISDLRALTREERTPAVLFYSARILEALAAEACVRAFGRSTARSGIDLNRLSELGALPAPLAAELHALNRLGQDCLLARRPIHGADASAALLFVWRLLDWFFLRFDRGPKLSTLGGPSALLGKPLDSDLNAALDGIANAQSADECAALPAEYPSAFLRTPVVVGVYLERVLAFGGVPTEAVRVHAEQALESFPRDGHLRRLSAQVLSATGETEVARDLLEQLNDDHPGDAACLSLLAEQYRALWSQAAPEESETLLRRALMYYQEAWARSRETDRQAGIQAALLGLLRGRTQRAESIAHTLVESYSARWHAQGSRFAYIDYADRITLAHSALILGETEYARRRYLEAFSVPSAQKAAIANTKRELKAMLLALDVRASVTRFLEGGVATRRRRVDLRQLTLPMVAESKPGAG